MKNKIIFSKKFSDFFYSLDEKIQHKLFVSIGILRDFPKANQQYHKKPEYRQIISQDVSVLYRYDENEATVYILYGKYQKQKDYIW